MVRVAGNVQNSPDNGGLPSKRPRKTSDAGHILFVDDELSICRCAAEMVRSLGYKVTAMHDGSDALEYYRENWRSVSLVILDMVMPKMSGVDTFVAMKLINPRIRAVLASGYLMNCDAQTVSNLGFAAY
jgi:CheY-like chemotaxis protein